MFLGCSWWLGVPAQVRHIRLGKVVERGLQSRPAKAIKEISADLGLPANESVWHRVSIIYRREADRLGLARSRRPKQEAK